MTSRKSFFNFDIMAESLKQTKYIMVLHTIMLFLTTSIPAYFIFQTVQDYVDKHNVLKTLSMWLSGANPLVGLISIAIPIITAIYLFSYLFKSNSVQFFNSMPYTRSCMYISRFVACLVSIVLPVLFVFAVNSVIYVSMNFAEYFAYSDMLSGLLYQIVSYISLLCLMVFSISLSGNAFAAIIAASFLSLFYYATTLSIAMSFGEWFNNLMINFSYNPMYICPPWTIFCKSFGMSITNNEIIYSAIYSVVLFALGLLFYVKRRAENTNKFFAYKAIGSFLKYYISLVASLAFGAVFLALSNKNIAVGYVGYILILFIVYAMLQAIFDKDMRGMFSHMKKFVVLALIWGALLLPSNLGLWEKVNFERSFTDAVRVNDLTWRSDENKAAASKLYNESDSEYTYSDTARTISFVSNPDNPFFTIERVKYCKSFDALNEYEKCVYSSEEYLQYLENALSRKFSDASIRVANDSDYISQEDNPSRRDILTNELIPLLKEEISKYDYETCVKSGQFAEINLYGAETYTIPVYLCYEKSVGVIKDKMCMTNIDWKDGSALRVIKEEDGSSFVVFATNDKDEAETILDSSIGYLSGGFYHLTINIEDSSGSYNIYTSYDKLSEKAKKLINPQGLDWDNLPKTEEYSEEYSTDKPAAEEITEIS